MKSGQKLPENEADNFRCRKSRCNDCGFTKGTTANLSGVTAIKAQLCAEVPTPFFCHFNVQEGEIPDGKEVLCAGFVETCNDLAARGHYERQPAWERLFKLEIVETIAEIENSELSDDEATALMQQTIDGFLSKI